MNTHTRRRGQVSLEFALSMLVTIVFVGLVINLFIWFCGTIVKRHERFEETRTGGTTIDFYDQYSEANKMKLWKDGDLK